MLPYLIRMSGLLYLVIALTLGGVFLWRAWQLWQYYSDARARRTFSYSIVYLTLLFAAMLVDHYL
jgi:protoheme IX farnesyltransferase